MPSPTSSTRPVSRTSSCWPKPEICRSMIEVISLALSLSAMGASGHQLGAEALQARPHGAVVNLVADLDHEPAEQVGVHLQVKHRLLVQGCREGRANLVLLIVRERDRRTHGD